MLIPMRDIIVLLPGITGSVLQKDGKDVWALSGQAITTFLRSFGGSLQRLKLEGCDDPNLNDLGDGVVATRLIPDAHIIPGLWKVDGYEELTKFLQSEFQLEEGQNFFEFPYDWRRDNRVAAKKLELLIGEGLKSWRESSGNANAKAILIAHSMGGLVSRYYIELLEGWKTCRALITFGTPYRGSIKALNFLANGHRIVGIDLSDMLRSCTSVYQLLPTYPVVRSSSGAVLKPSELETLGGLDPSRAANARSFHKAIEDAVALHLKLDEYRNELAICPVIGCDQPTPQSADLHGRQLFASYHLPPDVDSLMDYGDGTVPLASAVPLEMSKSFFMPFYAELHGSLQNNVRILASMREWLRQSQVKGLEKLKAVPIDQVMARQRSAICLTVEDAYAAGEPVVIKAVVQGSGKPAKVLATIYRIDSESNPLQREFIVEDGNWMLMDAGLPEGCYRVKVRCSGGDMEVVPTPVTDVFCIMKTGKQL